MSDVESREDRLIKMRELSAMLGKSSRTIEREIAADTLPSKIKIGVNMYYRYSEIQSYIGWSASIDAEHADRFVDWLSHWELSFKDYKALCPERAEWTGYVQWLDENESSYSHYKESVIERRRK